MLCRLFFKKSILVINFEILKIGVERYVWVTFHTKRNRFRSRNSFCNELDQDIFEILKSYYDFN